MCIRDNRIKAISIILVFVLTDTVACCDVYDNIAKTFLRPQAIAMRINFDDDYIGAVAKLENL